MPDKSIKVAVIGGGAAGFFSAIHCSENHPNSEVFIFEKTNKLLSKVKVSGGGRCNVTNACFSPSELSKSYPRGERFLKKAFYSFSTQDTINWFEKRGVELKAEPDKRMFPVTDDSQTIVDCLMDSARRLNVKIKVKSDVSGITKTDNAFILTINGKEEEFSHVIIASGGSPKLSGFDWIKELGHSIIPPVPSLFTLNMPKEDITQLMGVTVKNASIRLQGSKLQTDGPLLITHWGMSGPAVLKLSAWGARELNDLNYKFKVSVNWVMQSEQLAFEVLEEAYANRAKFGNRNPFDLPKRLWAYLAHKCGIDEDQIWLDIKKKDKNRFINVLINDVYDVSGKTTFKEEFVTCGGVNLKEISVESMQSKFMKGLYFCGEVMDIDAITGGFNFQAAWTTGFIAGKLNDK
jgi:predicted Rossmann fold flavoprotein